jgi:hypothetical protein
MTEIMSIHKATECGYLSDLNNIINEGAEVNEIDNFDWIPLHRAILTYDIPIIRTLINAHTDINIMDDYGSTALHIACGDLVNNNINVVSYLIDAGANIHHPNNDGNTPLHIACGCNHIDLNIIKTLLHYSANPNAINKDGNTPLHIAYQKLAYNICLRAYYKNIPFKPNKIITRHDIKLDGKPQEENLISILLNHKANPNIKNNKNETPAQCYNSFELPFADFYV